MTSLVTQDSKESTYNAGDLNSTPGLERSLGEGNGNLLQYSGLENSMDRAIKKEEFKKRFKEKNSCVSSVLAKLVY